MERDQDTLFDARVVERHIQRGLVTREEYEAWLASLEDVGENAEECETRFVHTRKQDAGDDA